MVQVNQNCMLELSFRAINEQEDPFNEVTLDVLITNPDEVTQLVPAFWAGGDLWKVRYASQKLGKHGWQSVCSDSADAGLHGQEGEFEVVAYTGENLLLRHGPLRKSESGRFLEHADGTPFFWLADTWWMGLCKRLHWPEDFQSLTSDRVRKGYSVVQIVVGPYPDMAAFDERGLNEAGFPWEKDWTRINPAYFDMADRRIRHLVEEGITPCILGCWGYYLQWMGIDKMKQHWRYLVARYGAYPVVWCLAGEGMMPYYLSTDKEKDRAFQKKGWTELGAYVREIDPYHHPLTIHPTDSSSNQVEDRSLLDIDMLQTGHGDRESIPNTLKRVAEAYERKPSIPVLNSEVCYEGIGEACRQEVQRFMFWTCMLSGACGHTYGANGIWQVNCKDEPYGPSPHGQAWGHTPWQEAAQLPGSGQLGLGKRLLERYPWWCIEPHHEWVDGHGTPEKYKAPFAAGIPQVVRFFFLPSGVWGVKVRQIEADTSYRAFLFSPVDGHEIDLGVVQPDAEGSWEPSMARAPIFQDWVLVLEKRT